MSEPKPTTSLKDRLKNKGKNLKATESFVPTTSTQEKPKEVELTPEQLAAKQEHAAYLEAVRIYTEKYAQYQQDYMNTKLQID